MLVKRGVIVGYKFIERRCDEFYAHSPAGQKLQLAGLDMADGRSSQGTELFVSDVVLQCPELAGMVIPCHRPFIAFVDKGLAFGTLAITHTVLIRKRT